MSELRDNLSYKVGELSYVIEREYRSLQRGEIPLIYLRMIRETPRIGIDSVRSIFPRLFLNGRITERLEALGNLPVSLDCAGQSEAVIGYYHAIYQDHHMIEPATVASH